MARHIIESITDDLDGSANAKAVTFGYNGVEYSIDLSSKNKNAFDKLMKPYLDNATRVGGRRSGGGSTRRGRSSGGKRSDLEAVRGWARDNGHTVSDRGRISAAILEAYDSAH